MDTVLLEQSSSMEVLQKSMSMYGRRSTAPRPLSEATLIFDTDDEEEEQSRRHRPFPALFANSSASVNKSRRPALERSLSISDLGLEVTASISAARSPSTVSIF